MSFAPRKSNLRITLLEIAAAILLVAAIAELSAGAQSRLYRLLLSPLFFLAVLAALFLATRRKN